MTEDNKEVETGEEQENVEEISKQEKESQEFVMLTSREKITQGINELIEELKADTNESHENTVMLDKLNEFLEIFNNFLEEKKDN